MSVIVTRSPLRLLAYVVLAVPALLVAVDMTASHRFFPAPETFETVVGTTVDEVGRQVDVTARALTIEGRAQARRDRLAAAVLGIGGVAAMAWAMMELIRPRVLLRGDQQGMAFRVDGPGRPMRQVAWGDIAEVRSGVVDDEGDLVPALSIRFEDPARVPVAPASAIPEPPWLHLLADDWVPPAHMVAPLLERTVPGSVPAEMTE